MLSVILTDSPGKCGVLFAHFSSALRIAQSTTIDPVHQHICSVERYKKELECRHNVIAVTWSYGNRDNDVNSCAQEGKYAILCQCDIGKEDVFYSGTLIYIRLYGDRNLDRRKGRK